MKIINKIAIEPACLSSWDDFRYVMEKLSFSNGLVLSKVPKRWEKTLLDALPNTVGEIERRRIVTKLQSYKLDRMVASGIPYEPNKKWIENVLGKQNKGKFDKILASNISKLDQQRVVISTPAEADEEFFRTQRDIKVENTPNELCDVARILLETTSIVVFVDPFFRVHRNSSFLKTLAQFAITASSSGRYKKIVIFADSKSIPKGREQEIDKALDESLAPLLLNELSVTTYYVSDDQSKSYMHPRYLLTDKGGLKYDKGFDYGRPPKKVDVGSMDQQLFKESFDRFVNLNHDFDIAFSHEWAAPKN